ncbi:hypothetical protein [Nannocystis pusilla]|uniref:hypothetical protein n=1 Tax=Nannocystis pusilla TaxID=889268 RepID=UPI003B7F136D
MRRSAMITPATTLQLDEARLELHTDGPMARAELIWPNDYGTRMLAYGPYSDVMERVIECGRYGVGCGPLASSRPHQWQEFKQDGSYRASTSRGELRVLPFGSKFALVHVLTDGGVAWLSSTTTGRKRSTARLPASGKHALVRSLCGIAAGSWS